MTAAEQTEIRHTPEEVKLFQPAVHIYRHVFRREPEVQPRRLPGGSPAMLFSGWLLLYPTEMGDGWGVRTEGTRERFKDLPCLRKPQEAEKGNFGAAVIHLCYMESHRLVHEAEAAA